MDKSAASDAWAMVLRFASIVYTCCLGPSLVLLVSCHNRIYMDLIGVIATVSVTIAYDAVESAHIVIVEASPETCGYNDSRGNSLECNHTLLSHKVVGMWKCIGQSHQSVCLQVCNHIAFAVILDAFAYRLERPLVEL